MLTEQIDLYAGIEIKPQDKDDDLVAATKKYVIAYPMKNLISQHGIFQTQIQYLKNGQFNNVWLCITETVFRIYGERQYAVDAEDSDEPIL